MKNVSGGKIAPGDPGGPSVVRGKCTGSVGEWVYGTPVWYITCWNDIDMYCSSGSGMCLTS